MSRSQARTVLVLVCASFFLSGCGSGATATPVPGVNPVNTVAVPTVDPNAPTSTPASTVDPTCTRSQLEQYLQYSSTMTEATITAINQALVLPPDQLDKVLNEIGQHKSTLDRYTAPDCARELQVLVDAMYRDITDSLNKAKRGEAVDMGAVVVAANLAWDAVKAKVTELIAVYETLPRDRNR